MVATLRSLWMILEAEANKDIERYERSKYDRNERHQGIMLLDG